MMETLIFLLVRRQDFAVTVSDFDNDTLLLQWLVDYLPVANQTSESFTFTAEETGEFEVKVLVTDNKDYVTNKWFVTATEQAESFSITGATVSIASQSSGLWSWLKTLF